MIDRRALVGAASLAALMPRPAQAQTFPQRPPRLVIPFSAGGATDIIGRTLGNRLSDVWGQAVVVDNRTGAGGNIAAVDVARSAPDGHTLMIHAFPMVANRFLYASPGYELSDFSPLSMTCLMPNIMVVSPNHAAKSVAEFIGFAKSNRGKVTFASAGNGSSHHLSAELFLRLTGIEMTHVPYRGSAPALIDVISGRVDVMFDNVTSAISHVREGTLRGLGVTTAARVPQLPQIPTVAEAGVPDYEVVSWFGLLGPARLPPQIQAKISGDAADAASHPSVRERLENLGAIMVGDRPDTFSAFIDREAAKWSRVIRDANIRIDG
ncbi:MAG: tripartite tricarboxylate transporter substrate binding protein [Alphaproteobacteria bacterium]